MSPTCALSQKSKEKDFLRNSSSDDFGVQTVPIVPNVQVVQGSESDVEA